jgi:hypothetical protein
MEVFSTIDGIVDEIYEQLPVESLQPPLQRGRLEKEDNAVITNEHLE